ncbi:MAG: B12-binding domain-containing radical SAM protein [Deltaproteobacteria bacterium]|nr:B12-binding domain-containing radical SAM protein [Deltaproteobacteria bacterium]
MKVLLINAPIRLDAKPNCIPSGLATIAATLRGKGFDVEIYDVNALRPPGKEILETLRRKSWNVVGLSGLVTTYEFQKWLIPHLKTLNPGAPVISGGGLATSSSALLFQHTPVDMAVIGEGEETILELCRAIQRDGDLGDVAGIRFRKNGRVETTRKRDPIPDLDAVPFPAWDLLPMEIYLGNPIWGDVAGNSSGFKRGVKVTRSMNVISSRGCPFSCNYCYHLFGRSNYRFRSAENVADEVETLVDRYGVDFIGFVDDNMTASDKRLLQFCDLVERRRLPISWGCHGRVTSARPEILQRMAEVGCVWIGYGIESGSQEILDAMNKKARVAQAKEAIRNTRKAGIYPNTTFIFGYPGETRETIQETVDFKKETGIECGSFFATPYPETPLYHQIRDLIRDEESFLSSLGNATEFTINLTGFEDEEMFRLKRMMDENLDVVDRIEHEPRAGAPTGKVPMDLLSCRNA